MALSAVSLSTLSIPRRYRRIGDLGIASYGSASNASNGSYTDSNGYVWAYWNYTSTSTFSVTKAGLFDAVIVGAGASGAYQGAGGNGGQVLVRLGLANAVYLSVGSQSITVGASPSANSSVSNAIAIGGGGASGGGYNTVGSNGTFVTIRGYSEAFGGGGGGGGLFDSGYGMAGRVGGAGGGGTGGASPGDMDAPGFKSGSGGGAGTASTGGGGGGGGQPGGDTDAGGVGGGATGIVILRTRIS